MGNPSVACVLLANGRPHMVVRAIRSFTAQTYDNRVLIIWDTGEEPLNIREPKAVYCRPYSDGSRSIGELRNEAIGLATTADIIVTFDSDDWSHPQRIEEQVRLLEASGAEVVGYSECLFWDERTKPVTLPTANKVGFGYVERNEAYLYSNPRPHYAVGASLAFWRDTWKRRPFPHLPIPGNRQSAGEDGEWLKGVRCQSISGMNAGIFEFTGNPMDGDWEMDPRLICSIHGQNSNMYELALHAPEFQRAPQWDEYCRRTMALEVTK